LASISSWKDKPSTANTTIDNDDGGGTRKRFLRREELPSTAEKKDRYALHDHERIVPKAKDLGRTMGVPLLPQGVSSGTLPVRLGIGPYGDGLQVMGYC
jgi:hypothetical protein